MILSLIFLSLMVEEKSETCLDEYKSNLYPPIVRPGLDPSSWNGALFLGKGESLFGVRVGLLVGDEYITGRSVYDAVNKVGPHSPDGSYARINFGKYEKSIILCWSTINSGVIVGSVRSLKENTTIGLEVYFPWDYPGVYSAGKGNNAIVGKAPKVLIQEERWFQGNCKKNYFFLKANRNPEERGLFSSKEDLIKYIEGKSANKGFRSGLLKYTLDKNEVLTFYAAIKEGKYPTPSIIKHEEILNLLDRKRDEYESRRFKGSGSVGKVATAIINEEFWMLAYQPNHNTNAQYPRSYAPAGRPWVYDIWGSGDWTTYCWDPMFQSYILALEDKWAAYNTIFSVLLASQLENGMIPNTYWGNVWKDDEAWEKSTQAPVASYFTWKLFERFHDIQFLEYAYPSLKKWFNWWLSAGPDSHPLRDGNEDGLLEWGLNGGLDDSPMWDDAKIEGGHMNLNSIWLNSLRALDCEMMGKIAEQIGKLKDAKKFREEYRKISRLINEHLWNEDVGMYLSRYWDGEWEFDEGTPTITPACFTALLAGIPDRMRAKIMVQEHLMNPEEFWGEYVIPTINKNHPDYKPPYTYWRGTIWPPTNYIVYEGLKRYHYDSVAAQIAKKSTELWWGPWREKNWACENYHPETGKRSIKSHKHQGWSMNLPLTGVQEIIDIEVWSESIDDIRFGGIGLNGNNKLNNVKIHGFSYDVMVGSNRTELYRNDQKVFQAKGGKLVVRDFRERERNVSFLIKNKQEVSIKLYPPLTMSKVEFSVPVGTNQIIVQKDKLKIVPAKDDG